MKLIHAERVFAPNGAETAARILPRTTVAERFRADLAVYATTVRIQEMNAFGIEASATIIEGKGPTDPTVIALHVPRARMLASTHRALRVDGAVNRPHPTTPTRPAA